VDADAGAGDAGAFGWRGLTGARLREIKLALGLTWGGLARGMGRSDYRALRRWASGTKAIPAVDAAWLEDCAAAGKLVPRPARARADGEVG